MFPIIPKAQEKDALSIKQKTISEARYLKSRYKTDKAITLLSGLLRPDCFDEELLSELADCHMQAGDYESAASTYRMLQLHLYLKHGKVGSSGYAFAQESLEYVKQQLFIEEP